jgi:hypothetical protein
VRQDPDQLCVVEGINKLGIEVQRDTVSRHGRDRTACLVLECPA